MSGDGTVDSDGCRQKCVNVGLVAPEPIRRAGLVSVLENHPYIRIVRGELDRLVSDSSLQYLILDLSSNSGWIKVLFSVRRRRRDIRQIIVGPSGDDEHVLQSLSAGARAFLDSNSGPLAVRQAVECVIDGMIWAPRRLMSVLIDRLLVSAANPSARSNPTEKEVATTFASSTSTLSPREVEVLQLIGLAHSNREIAQLLGIEERTVKAHVANLFRKTGMENRVSLLMRASQRDPQVPAEAD